ncbi:MAG: thioesterase family protein [Alphaproteobacteria bacterium]
MADASCVRADFGAFLSIQTRWADMDAYGHVNNMVFYSYIDSAVTAFLVNAGGHDKDRAPAIGLVVESGCRYFKPLAFPAAIDCGVRVARLGRSSVRYEVGMFEAGDEEPAALGFFVHVFVDRTTMRPTDLPANIRGALEPLSRLGEIR